MTHCPSCGHSVPNREAITSDQERLLEMIDAHIEVHGSFPPISYMRERFSDDVVRNIFQRGFLVNKSSNLVRVA